MVELSEIDVKPQIRPNYFLKDEKAVKYRRKPPAA